MNYTALLKSDQDYDIAQDPTTLAAVLPDSWKSLERSSPDDNHDLISQLLAYAAQAEQKIADQNERIAHLETLTHTDELTGLCNRRSFELAIKKALATASRHGEHGMVGLFDLDGFKEINDTYGHEAGDRVLKHVAETLRTNVRGGDCAARIGGDEFAVTLTQCAPHGGTRTLQRIQASIENSIIEYNGLQLSVGASLGVQSFDGRTQLRDLLFHADRAMYQNKRLRKIKPV